MHIPDDILEEQICLECHQYLSVKPVKVYSNKQVKCGRCSEENDGGVISTNFLLIAEMFEFPCVNRFEGCDIYLPYSDMKSHENQCIATLFECPKCSFKGSAYFLLKHFQDNHPNSIIYDQTIPINLTQESRPNDYCILTIEGPNTSRILAIVIYAYDTDTKRLTFEAQYCSPKTQNLFQSLKLYSLNNKLQWISEVQTTCQWKTYDNNPISVCIKTDDYSDRILICKVSVQAEQCVYLKSSKPTRNDKCKDQICCEKDSTHDKEAKNHKSVDKETTLFNEEKERSFKAIVDLKQKVTEKKLADLEREMNKLKENLSNKNQKQGSEIHVPGPSRISRPQNNLLETPQFIHEQAKLRLHRGPKNYVVVNEEALVTFTNISFIGQRTYQSQHFKFYNMTWQFFAEKSRSGKALALGITLAQKNGFIRPCSVFATFTLLSSVVSGDKTESFEDWYIIDKNDYDAKIDFISWNELMDPNNGFVSFNDIITVNVRLGFTSKAAGKR